DREDVAARLVLAVSLVAAALPLVADVANPDPATRGAEAVDVEAVGVPLVDGILVAEDFHGVGHHVARQAPDVQREGVRRHIQRLMGRIPPEYPSWPSSHALPVVGGVGSGLAQIPSGNVAGGRAGGAAA